MDIYEEYFRELQRYLLSLCRDSRIAEELTQETFFPGRPLRRAVPGGATCGPGCTPLPGTCSWTRRGGSGTPRSSCPGAAGHGGSHFDGGAGGPGEEALRLHCLLHGLGEPYKEGVPSAGVRGTALWGHRPGIWADGELGAGDLYRAKQKIIAGLEEEKHGG